MRSKVTFDFQPANVFTCWLGEANCGAVAPQEPAVDYIQWLQNFEFL
jgi:hypothetical protein